MRIVISGAQSTGKTTLLNLIKKIGPTDPLFCDVPVLDEVVRNLAAEQPGGSMALNRNARYQDQLEILLRHYTNAHRYPSFITDRGAVDAYVYALVNHRDGKYSDADILQFENILTDSLKRYDLHFYLPPEFAPVDDGFRDTDTTYQQAIHHTFLEVYDTFLIPFRILTGSTTERYRALSLEADRFLSRPDFQR